MTHSLSARLVAIPMIVAFCPALVLSGCGRSDSSSSGSGTAAQTYALSGTVSGLSGSGLALNVNGAPVMVSRGASSVALASGLASGSAYRVSVGTQPTGQTCSIAGGTGTIASANVANVVVTCADQAYALGGTISGLNGSGLVLANGSDTLTVAAGATHFTLPTTVAYTSSYGVTVQTQPAGLACAVARGSGGMPASAVTNVMVTCTDQPFTVAGTISGLGAHTGLTLTQGADTLSVPASATTFVLQTPVAFGSPYAVKVQASPAGLTCSAANAGGTVGAANVTTISITCSDRSYAVGGTIAGLTSAGLVLANGTDTLSVPVNAGGFTMNAPVAFTGSYSITVQSNPAGLTCSVANGSGTLPAGAVSTVAVTCSVSTYTIGGSVSGLGRSGLVLLDNGTDATAIAAHAASFTMNTGMAYGAPYLVSVRTQPYGIDLACSPASASGTVSAEVTTVAVGCATVTPVQSVIAGYFQNPEGVAVDAAGNVYVADTYNNAVKKIPYSNGSYGVPVTLGSGFSYPTAVAVDAAGNVYVADPGNNAVTEIPYSNGSYGTPVTIGSGFSYPSGVAVDAAGNVFVADTGNSAIKEIPYSNGSYGTPITIGSGFSYPSGVAVDVAGNVFVADTFNNAVTEIPYSNGSYDTPVPLGSGFNLPKGVAVDTNGRLYATDGANVWLFTP
jgi:sugar lactone lactonase YvrE